MGKQLVVKLDHDSASDCSPRRLAFGVVILAAGASSRMGQPKLLLPWGKTSILGHLVQQWNQLGSGQVAVVQAALDKVIPEELDRLTFPQSHRILNPAPEQGMYSSIQCAARWDGWQPALTHWVITLGDQPQVHWEALAALVRLGSAHPTQVCQLSYQGRPRHPIWLPKPMFERLRDTTVSTLKSFLQNASDMLYSSDYNDPGLAMDIDRPEDYLKAVEFYFHKA